MDVSFIPRSWVTTHSAPDGCGALRRRCAELWGAVGCRGEPWGAVGCGGEPWGENGCKRVPRVPAVCGVRNPLTGLVESETRVDKGAP